MSATQDRHSAMRRRTFVGLGLAATGTAISCSRGETASSWRFFTGREARTVDALCEQIIPADNAPGASERGVVNYIDIQLTKCFAKHQQTYRDGIAASDVTSRERFGMPFVELSSEQKAEVLDDLVQSSREFVGLILAHTRQGYYGDPRHGGNRDMASWKMVGLPFPPVRGRQHLGKPNAG